MATIAMTGHRPEKIGMNKDALLHMIATGFEVAGATTVIQGMAAGVDLWSAYVAYKSGIPFICAVPWTTHKPRVADRAAYAQALQYAAEVHVVTEADHYPGPWVYQKRNEWMVDHADMILSVWDGVEDGGTWNCVEYALEREKRILNIDPNRIDIREVT